ncbi:hypothetical protein NP493_4504g00000 [Ridgeia piscesae]|uniref:Uncharacterized protein n=1 Tax=Ridgeia piscesae TaxID=27915 RepID=A0AAD9MT37_RIDPI|nr:hypothetical protein NP493_4504g00000 [Ridgeia piscesae]
MYIHATHTHTHHTHTPHTHTHHTPHTHCTHTYTYKHILKVNAHTCTSTHKQNTHRCRHNQLFALCCFFWNNLIVVMYRFSYVVNF